MTFSFTPLYAPITDSEILAVTQAAFGSKTQLDRARPAKGGLFNTSYVIETSHPSQKAILRVAPANQAVLVGFEKTMMAAEPAIYNLMRAAGAPIPQALFIDTTHKIIPRDYIFIETIDAVPMNDPTVPESEKKLLRFELGQYMRLIHSVRGTRFGWPLASGVVRGDDRWDKMLWGFFEELLRLDVNCQELLKTDAQLIETLWNRQAGIFTNARQPALVHNDLWEPNILVRPGADGWHIAALIDGDRAMFADPEYEFALWENNPDVIKGYGAALDASPEAGLRRNWYKLSLALMNLYVFKAEYLDEVNTHHTQQWVNHLLVDIQAGEDKNG
jgi:aminoglycoside phosphotransferase (APT) family kinase protein